LDYAHTFERLVLEDKFPDTSGIIGGDVIKDCWTQRISSAGEAQRRLVKLDHQLELQTNQESSTDPDCFQGEDSEI